jgi:hypothetical protein
LISLQHKIETEFSTEIGYVTHYIIFLCRKKISKTSPVHHSVHYSTKNAKNRRYKSSGRLNCVQCCLIFVDPNQHHVILLASKILRWLLVFFFLNFVLCSSIHSHFLSTLRWMHDIPTKCQFHSKSCKVSKPRIPLCIHQMTEVHECPRGTCSIAMPVFGMC